MTREGAERAISISALIVFGLYFYRHLTEGTSANPTTTRCPAPTTKGGVIGKSSQLIGFGTPANVGQFITAWGFVFFVLAVVGSAAPGVGGSFAILAATTDVLANTCQLTHDINQKIGTTSSTKSPVSGVTGTASAGMTGGSGVTSDPLKGVSGSVTA